MLVSEKKFPIIVLHNVVSTKTCSEFVKIASGMGYNTLIITNAQGSAAQRGIPSAQKLALKNNINFLVLSEINDIKELFNPELIVIVAPTPYGKEELNHQFIKMVRSKRSVIVFGGNEPGLSRKDLEKGDHIVQLPVGDIGSIGSLTLGLAMMTNKFQFIKEQEAN